MAICHRLWSCVVLLPENALFLIYLSQRLCCSNLYNRDTGVVVMLLAFLVGPPTHSIKADRLSFSYLKTSFLNF